VSLTTTNPQLTNGNLTRAVFETAGLVVSDRPAIAPRLESHQPSKREVIRLGEEAMVRLAFGRSWEDWTHVMRALDIGRSTAMLEAGTNRPQGHRYREAFRKWLRLYEVFEALDKSDRSRFHKCFDNLDAINAWRNDPEQSQRVLKVNYPPTVLRLWETWKKGQTKTKTGGKTESPSNQLPKSKLAEVWAASTLEERREVIGREGRTGLAELVPADLLAELADHALGQRIHAAPRSNKLQVTLTNILVHAIYTESTNERLAAFDAFKSKCRANKLDPRDAFVGFRKKVRR